MINRAVQLRIEALVAKMTPEEKACLCSGADYWHTEPLERLGIESIYMCDGPHGLRREREDMAGELMPDSEPATCFPTASALACGFDRELTAEIGRALGEEAACHDVSVVLGPGVNIKRSPLCGRNFEYFSEDPCLAGEMAAAQISGIEGQGVAACIKHLAANNQENRRFVSDSLVDMRALREIYLEPFRRAIKKSRPRALMTSYNRLRGVYTGESEWLLRDVLRGEWGFEGLVMSDWGAVNDRVTALKAGLDLEMPGKTSATADDILAALKSGELKEEELNAAVGRILALTESVARTRRKHISPNYEQHRLLARRAASECLVLLKNEGNILPVEPGERVAIVGLMARSVRYQGVGSSRVNAVAVDNVYDELKTTVQSMSYCDGYNADGSTNDLLIGEAKEAATAADKTIVFLGLPENCESEGFDRESLSLPDGMLKLIDQLSFVCDSLAVVLMVGAPVELPFLSRVRGLMVSYLGGQAAGAAIADGLLGRVSPSGKLCESWPRRLADTPCARYYGKKRKNAEYREGLFVGYRFYDAVGVEPAFPFGAGLSYTTFSYDSFRADSQRLRPGGELRLSLRLTNSGRRSGAEAVQIYVARKGERYKQLRDFKKVHLFAGESRVIEFRLTEGDFSDYDTARNCWRSVGGDYVVTAASSSADLRESVELTVEGDGLGPLPPYINASEAASLSDEGFERLLGYRPQEPDWLPLTLNSTMNELRRRLVGKIVWSVLESSLPSVESSGRPADIILERSLGDMPLRALSALSRGLLDKRHARAIVCLAGRRPLRGIRHLISRRPLIEK